MARAGTVTCSYSGSYASGASDTFELTVGTDPDLASGTVIADRASITGTATDPNPANNSASASTTVGVSADMAVTDIVADGSSQQRQGTYTLTYANNGPSTAHDVTVIDTLPAGVSFDSADDTNCTQSSGTVTCSEGTMTPGQTGTIHVVATANAVGPQHDVAAVSADEPDPNAQNNTASADINVGPTADLTITKTTSTPNVPAGATATSTNLGAERRPLGRSQRAHLRPAARRRDVHRRERRLGRLVR